VRAWMSSDASWCLDRPVRSGRRRGSGEGPTGS
jgi:hypothetical protein